MFGKFWMFFYILDETYRRGLNQSDKMVIEVVEGDLTHTSQKCWTLTWAWCKIYYGLQRLWWFLHKTLHKESSC